MQVKLQRLGLGSSAFSTVCTVLIHPNTHIVPVQIIRDVENSFQNISPFTALSNTIIFSVYNVFIEKLDIHTCIQCIHQRLHSVHS